MEVFNAILQSNVKKLQDLLNNSDNPFNMNSRNHFGFTAFHFAVLQNHAEIIQLLLNHGVEVNTHNLRGDTPLHNAVMHEDIALIKILLNYGADPNYQNKKKESAFHKSFELCNDEVIDTFLNYNTNVILKDGLHQNALHLAARYSSYKVIHKLLLQMQLNSNEKTMDLMTPLHLVLDYNSSPEKIILDIVRLLVIDYKADINAINKKDKTPLYYAAKNNHLMSVEYLLSLGADINGYKEQLPIFQAIIKGNVEIVKCLLNHGAKIDFENHNNENLLHIALFCKDEESSLEIVKLLLNQGVEINNCNNGGMTILHLALQNRYLRLFQFLIDSGACVHLKNDRNETPLFTAVNNNLYNEAKILIGRGSDVNSCNVNQTHITELAISLENEEMLSLLLNNGANANDLTGLIISASLNLVNMMKLLVAHGAMKDPDDFTKNLIFNEALKYQNFDMIEYLIDIGADINNDLESVTPLDYMLTVSGNQQSHIIDVLLKRIAFLEAQNLYVHEMNINLIQSTPWILESYNSYFKELIKMKETKICIETSKTYFDVLTKPHYVVGNYLRCKHVNASLMSKNYNKSFSLYNKKLEENYLLAFKRLEMINELQTVLQDVFGSVLVEDVIIKITEYFNDQDLEIFSKK